MRVEITSLCLYWVAYVFCFGWEAVRFKIPQVIPIEKMSYLQAKKRFIWALSIIFP